VTFTPTEEQLALVSAASQTDDNLLVEALAGAAKTSSLILVAEALPSVQILALAFNKKIAIEMQERLPSNCKAMTLNALGHRTWMEATGRRLAIDAGKCGNILKEHLTALPGSRRDAAWDRFGDLLKIIEFGKQCGYIPTNHFEKGKRLMDCEEFFAHLDQKLEDWEVDLIRDVTLESINQALQGKCDFNDQIFMPTIFHGAFPRYPLILVDEAQDLSSLNHATLRKLVKKRIIAVGDSRQAIYGFRGAHEDSMRKLSETFKMRELQLSISFRCPKAVIEAARWRAPHMQWPEWAKEGSVSHLTTWSVADLPEHAAIICRNNAPLLSLAIKLLKNGRTSEVANADVGKQILKILTKLGDKKLPQTAVLDAIERWEEKEKRKVKQRAWGRVEDQSACLRIFADQGATLGDAIAYATHLLNSQGPLKLMTGHKSKGLEFDHVFFLDEHLIGTEDQEPNLRYVIQTRAKDTLTYVQSATFVE
jgi:DNA helicase-2/ATP-dependent DNA helicase PcrA